MSGRSVVSGRGVSGAGGWGQVGELDGRRVQGRRLGGRPPHGEGGGYEAPEGAEEDEDEGR